MPTITTYLDDEFMKWVRANAKRRSRSVSSFVRLCIESWIKRDRYVMSVEEFRDIVDKPKNIVPWQQEHIIKKYRMELPNDAR